MITIIPAIDIMDGKCVRLEKGDYQKMKIYSGDPLETARMFESWGISRLHLVDLDGAKAKKPVNIKVLELISTYTKLEIDYAGGLRTTKDITMAFNNGASMVTGGSIALQKPELFLEWLEIYGNEKVILGADHNSGKISINGWTEASDSGLFPFLDEFIGKGIKKVICTDIQKDGMLLGPSTDLYRKILEKWPGIELIASGGVAGIDDVWQLERAGVPAVIIGKAIYENRITESIIRKFFNDR